jgi:hypothetical protein
MPPADKERPLQQNKALVRNIAIIMMRPHAHLCLSAFRMMSEPFWKASVFSIARHF